MPRDLLLAQLPFPLREIGIRMGPEQPGGSGVKES
jgi:hypothetical protein